MGYFEDFIVFYSQYSGVLLQFVVVVGQFSCEYILRDEFVLFDIQVERCRVLDVFC